MGELERLLRHVTEELAGWRRRTLRAEAELQEIKAQGGTYGGPELAEARRRIVALETENQELRRRVEAARGRLEALGRRLSFLEQDMEREAS
ncbi:MAG TPA: hypothetical protein VNK43_11425 [Gemmatimonadales bacterium]|nr:hypothetical protein [Gemmatimonadales bacterium]